MIGAILLASVIAAAAAGPEWDVYEDVNFGSRVLWAKTEGIDAIQFYRGPQAATLEGLRNQ